VSTIRVLVVDDFEPWRRFYSTVLQNHPNLQIVGHVGAGLEAVREAQKLQPDLILLDIGLPTLNGLEPVVESEMFPPRPKSCS
jgi:chemotaxis response regulator CheB